MGFGIRYPCVRILLVALLLLSTCDFCTAAKSNAPGLSKSWELSIWENSKQRDVWCRVDECFEWRKYVLTKLSDMGLLDPLLKDLPKKGKKLRVLHGIGCATGIAVLLLSKRKKKKVRRLKTNPIDGSEVMVEV